MQKIQQLMKDCNKNGQQIKELLTQLKETKDKFRIWKRYKVAGANARVIL